MYTILKTWTFIHKRAQITATIYVMLWYRKRLCEQKPKLSHTYDTRAWTISAIHVSFYQVADIIKTVVSSILPPGAMKTLMFALCTHLATAKQFQLYMYLEANQMLSNICSATIKVQDSPMCTGRFSTFFPGTATLHSYFPPWLWL